MHTVSAQVGTTCLIFQCCCNRKAAIYSKAPSHSTHLSLFFSRQTIIHVLLWTCLSNWTRKGLLLRKRNKRVCYRPTVDFIEKLTKLALQLRDPCGIMDICSLYQGLQTHIQLIHCLVVVLIMCFGFQMLHHCAAMVVCSTCAHILLCYRHQMRFFTRIFSHP